MNRDIRLSFVQGVYFYLYLNYYIDLIVAHNIFIITQVMEQKNSELQSLIDENQNNIYIKTPSKHVFYAPKWKNLDFYQSLLCSTNYQGALFSQLNQLQGKGQVLDDIQFLQYDPKVKKRRGRPKKSETVSKNQQEYSAQEEDEIQGKVQLNKRKKKKLTKRVKGDSKNIFQFFYRIIASFIEKYSKKENDNIIKKPQANRFQLYQLLNNDQNQQIIRKMFLTRHLNRQVAASSRLSPKNKLFYLKKIQIFQHIFLNKGNCYEKNSQES